MEELGIAMSIANLISSFFSFAISVTTYVLTAWGLYTIAQRRGIEKPWLAWIPVANAWTLGCISDQYRYVVKGENKSKRKVLIGLSIASVVCTIVFFVLMIIGMVDVIRMGDLGSAAAASAALGSMGGALLMLIPIAGISIAYTVIYYIALYDVYTSCDPKNSVVYLILSIFISVTAPFFLFFNRKKDFGMPPRRPDPMQYMPPQQNWQQPQPNACYQPQQAQPNAYYQPQQGQPNAWQQPQQPQQHNNFGNPENF